MTEPEARGPQAAAHAELPLPDYDHLPAGTLTHRIRTLDLTDLEAVLAYERAHGNRLPVVQVLTSRLDELRRGAEPSGGSPRTTTPELPPPASKSSPVSPQTAGPPVNPPSHGDPTNPAQPR